MKALAIALLACSLAGCASNYWAGVSRYEIAPLQAADGNVIGCCSLRVTSGKEYQSIDATFVKTGDNYNITLSERQIEAFQGQAIAASVASDVAGAISNTAISAAKILK